MQLRSLPCKALVGHTRITQMSPAPGLSSGTAEIAAVPALQMLWPLVETQHAWASPQRLDQAWFLSSVWVVHRLLLACATAPMRHKHQGSPFPAGHVRAGGLATGRIQRPQVRP